jgi:hypothetical protein
VPLGVSVTRILFHGVRLIAPHSIPVTREMAQALIDSLGREDDSTEDSLLSHMFPRDGGPTVRREVDFSDPLIDSLRLGFAGKVTLDKDTFGEIYRSLSAQDRHLTAEQAQRLGFIDTIL